MAPPPEYDKEPKAPDKSATTIANDDSKLLHSIINDQQTNSDHIPSNTADNTEVENNKQVVNLDDGQLRALLDEAMNYKCPKDLEGKSNLFKELLEEVEQQDDQASEAAARGVSASRGARRAGTTLGGGGSGGRSRHALHSNSLQDLVAALAAESAPRRPRHHAPAPAPVSARATQGGSLPSGVDTSFLLGEEGGGARYLATVRCVNPPPLAERRVSASDANCPAEVEPLNNRRSKPVFPMTYTARATLEIGSGSVCSGRAVTTTTASNQVRNPATPAPRPAGPARPSRPVRPPDPNRLNPNQIKLMNALNPKGELNEITNSPAEGKTRKPRGPSMKSNLREHQPQRRPPDGHPPGEPQKTRQYFSPVADLWTSGVDRWYEGLAAYHDAFQQMARGGHPQQRNKSHIVYKKDGPEINITDTQPINSPNTTNTDPTIQKSTAPGRSVEQSKPTSSKKNIVPILTIDSIKYVSKKKNTNQNTKESQINKTIIVDESQEFYRVDRKKCDTYESDIRFRNEYRERVGFSLGAPKFISNPRNIRKMTISTAPVINISEPLRTSVVIQTTSNNKNSNVASNNNKVVIDCMSKEEHLCEEVECCKDSDYIISNKKKYKECPKDIEMNEIPLKRIRNHTDIKTFTKIGNENKIQAMDNSSIKLKKENNNDIELTDFVSKSQHKRDENTFLQFCATQEKFIQSLETTDVNYNLQTHDSKRDQNSKLLEYPGKDKNVNDLVKSIDELFDEKNQQNVAENTQPNVSEDPGSNKLVLRLNKPEEKVSNDQYILTELPNNAYVFLTLPKRLLTPLGNKVNKEKTSLQLHHMQNNPNVQANSPEDSTVARVSNKKKKEKVVGVSDDTKRKDAINKTALRVLLFENLKRDVSVKPRASTVAGEEGDSAIPFSCITTPEVVASCNTTSSTPQSAVAVDPKPLQLGSGYCAVASLTGAPPAPPAPSAPAAGPPAARQLQVFVPRLGLQPRSVISSSFNGLPLTRPGYGAAPAPDDYKKSLDENGNAVQGFSSPVSGSSQHKKPRRKKSSKNETVIKSHQIDGYQGNKDLNEVLRFIESNADAGRGKLADKGKKRSSERRKDKDKPKRASSLEELSRTKLEDLTAPRPAPAKPERRSWGDDARPAFYFAPAAAEPELADFQTVTKRRKPRRRADDAEREPPRRARPPSPSARVRRESAPPSERDIDSNDDAPSPAAPAAAAPPPAPAPHASYADIARTRHNIPDLIESCNFYAEGEGGEAVEGGSGGSCGSCGSEGSCSSAAAGESEYPALGPRGRPAEPRAARKPRAPPAAPHVAPHPLLPPPGCPAPDVVGDRRPPVILLDSGARPRDMDGVTFGFDINEQLLTGPARPRCDLVRDALELEGSTPTGVTVLAPAAASLAVSAGVVVGVGVGVGVGVAGTCGLRYVPPAPPRDTHHLHQIIDYVGNAWEDVVRCGGGKVRYFSE